MSYDMAPKPKGLAAELLEEAVAPELISQRRPDLGLDKSIAQAVSETVQYRNGELVLPLAVVVAKLRLSPSYSDPKRSANLASSLTRRFRQLGVPVRAGTRDGGKYIVFTDTERATRILRDSDRATQQ